jgi:mannitol-specific phosphotransferase system IIBC component
MSEGSRLCQPRYAIAPRHHVEVVVSSVDVTAIITCVTSGLQCQLEPGAIIASEARLTNGARSAGNVVLILANAEFGQFAWTSVLFRMRSPLGSR